MIRFEPCACAPGKMFRVHRSGWMRRLFPSRALYECACGRKFLASVAQQTELALRAQAERLRTTTRPTLQDERSATPAG